MELTDLEKIRFEKAQQMRADGVEPYPTRTEVNSTAAEAIRRFEAAEAAGSQETLSAVLGGRLRAVRLMGKLAFAHIEDGSGRIQLFFRVNELGEPELQRFKDQFDIGDYIQAGGELIRTRTGEISLLVREFKMLAKAITPLPAAKDEVVDGQVVRHATLADPETRYRQRYADLAVNPEVRDVFRARARVIQAVRRFLDERGFVEVETPILQPIYGGAAARPFTTFHNQLEQELFLRISFELYLKRLIGGGYERVYEIGRDFRNEGISFKHNPEFTMLEFYEAYADYNDIMRRTEEMVAAVSRDVCGGLTITYDGQAIDLTPPWRRMTMREAILQATGIHEAVTASNLLDVHAGAWNADRRCRKSHSGLLWLFVIDLAAAEVVAARLHQ